MYLKKIAMVLLLSTLLFTLTPSNSSYAADAGMKPRIEVVEKKSSENKDTDKKKTRLSAVINGTEYFLVLVTPPETNDKIWVDIPPVNDPIGISPEKALDKGK